ncbi:MAG TPA: aminotransferase class IV [Oculatellaceae cyanobacterium]|jgi:branched-subunit amino acid aminotransferase/4-amino-4-deoxychorismate lyase
MQWELQPDAAPRPCELPVALLSGFAVYTTFRWPLAPRWLQAHLERLRQNAETLGLGFPKPDTALLELLWQTLGNEETIARLTITAEAASYGDLFLAGPLPYRIFLSTRPVPPPVETPISLQTIRYTRPLPLIKLIGIGELIHFKRKALSAGFQDILLVNEQDHFTEASTANFFALDHDGRLWTPEPARDGCLSGITRQQVLEAAKSLQKPHINQQPLRYADLNSYQAAFLTNASQGLAPVGAIDHIQLPWPPEAQVLFRELKSVWQKLSQSEGVSPAS